MLRELPSALGAVPCAKLFLAHNALEKLSPLGTANIRAARTALGLGTRNVESLQTILELSYGIQLTPAVRLMPNLQYVIDPDQTRFHKLILSAVRSLHTTKDLRKKAL